jgi:type III restriction enzyme
MSTFRNEDLVLTVRPDYDPALINLDAYEGFLDALCEDREYQKEAIRTACRLLAGGEYRSVTELATENYAANPILAERYRSIDRLIAALPFPSKLASSIDLATGTGKSWVLYGIARILLAESIIDRVLLLCPSLTIEASLRTKFKRLSSDHRLLDLIPPDREFRVPDITDANTTTGPGDICIENIDATYRHVGSSVRDSFLGRGHSTLVLNDEAHHIYSPVAQADTAVKRWKEFLDSPEFGFARIIGCSGTCYRGNDYFADVTSRYSLRQAMDDGRVKLVHYVQKDESLNEEERFQKYLQLHRQNQHRYSRLKPLSIVVTAKIAGAEALADRFRKFLVTETGISPDDADERVLIVTSKKTHKANIAKLARVDRSDSPVEWVVSVSMLTEGWDVQNVFQVIPHEKRAFDSKLLIAQVLGRGLRVPPGMSQPVLRVFNHAKWSGEIANLVSEILEDERRLRSYPVTEGEHAKHHFEIHQLQYETETKTTELGTKGGNGQVNLFTRGLVQLESQSQDLERHTLFVSATNADQRILRTKVHYHEYTVDEVVQNMHGKLKAIDMESESETRYAKDYRPSKLREVVQASLDNVGETRGMVTEQNLQRLLRAMGNIRREVARTVRIELKPVELDKISTAVMPARSAALLSFMKEATVFYDSESLEIGEDADRSALKEITDDDSDYRKRAAKRIDNKFFFKSPVNVVLATHEPERAFLTRLFDPEVSAKVQAWIKSPDTGFYEIGYSWRRGDHTKQARFNPDLFIKLADSNDLLVVELKDDLDASDENRAKLRFASEHFGRINSRQTESRYHMKFISPISYDAFFDALKRDGALEYISALQATLSQ